MQSRLEENEEEGHDHLSSSYSSVDVVDDRSARLLPDNTELHIDNEMGQGPNDQHREMPATMLPQYFATLAAVLGGMTMGTTIGNTLIIKYFELKSIFF